MGGGSNTGWGNLYTEELHDLYSLPSIINDLEKRREEKGREGKRREEKGREGKGREEKRRELRCSGLLRSE